LIVADESGIVVIRSREIENIPTRAEERCRKEAALTNELRADCTTRN
jgi:regulator of RNase E activity RraA